jgi:DNA replication ATP-dependent helicase Dna2
VTSQQLEIVRAIEEELRSSGRQRRFRVLSAARQQNTIRMSVRPYSEGGRLDQTLERGVAAWGNWASSVVSVSIEDSMIYVHRIDAPVPVPGVEITVQPPRFLESLLGLWKKEDLAAKCFSWAAEALVGRDRRSLDLSPSFPELRQRQRAAYSLLSYRAGFLWGPPGTGKTTTAAAMVADLVTSDADARVLLIAPTNSAADQLLIATDNHLARSLRGQVARSDCARIGGNFLARYYEGRRHLLPEATDELVLQKAGLEAAQPCADEAEARARWQREMDGINASLRPETQTILKEKRVVAMTATLGTMHYGLLQDGQPFDLVVFDEASQLGRAVCLILAPLACRAIIAGDPRQLAPIVASNHPFVRKWFGRTLFDEYMHDGHPSTCLLNEQSRMAEAICGLVSKVFYRDDLRVSQECLVDDDWQAARQPVHLLSSGRVHNLHLVEIGTESAPHSGSHRRAESAEAAAEIAQQLGTYVDHGQILILTPFVAQRNLIRKVLKTRGMRRVRVSTVHAAQGAEIHTVIFDPVKGSGPFLLDPKNGSSLLNVAISRSKACFVLLASAGDLKHPLLSIIAAQIRGSDSPFLRNSDSHNPSVCPPATSSFPGSSKP